MPNLFDLPFEEADPEPDPDQSGPPAKPAAPSRPLSVKPQSEPGPRAPIPQEPVAPQSYRSRIEALRAETEPSGRRVPGTAPSPQASPAPSNAPPARAIPPAGSSRGGASLGAR